MEKYSKAENWVIHCLMATVLMYTYGAQIETNKDLTKAFILYTEKTAWGNLVNSLTRSDNMYTGGRAGASWHVGTYLTKAKLPTGDIVRTTSANLSQAQVPVN